MEAKRIEDPADYGTTGYSSFKEGSKVISKENMGKLGTSIIEDIGFQLIVSTSWSILLEMSFIHTIKM